jgi:hypothetical protein
MERKEKDGQSPPAGRTCAAEGAMSEHGAGAEDSALLRRLRDRTFRTLDGKALIAIDAVCGRRIVPDSEQAVSPMGRVQAGGRVRRTPVPG